MLKTPSFALALLPLALIGCNVQGGKLAAEGTGDLSYPLTTREAPDTEQAKLCGSGDPSPHGDATLSRLPYLQQVTSASADVLFSGDVTDPVAIEVTTPDGSEVGTFQAEPGADSSQRVVHIDGLEPSTVYCYSLSGMMTEPAGFRTAPETGSDSLVRFVAFGDSGSGDSRQEAVFEQLDTVPFDLMVHTGDIAYEKGTSSALTHAFFDVYAPILHSIPAFPISGNHDYKTSSAQPFREAFDLPKNGGPDARERYYSFDWGDVHFIALDTELVGAIQTNWLKQDLVKNSQPWTVVYLHKPPYSSGYHGSTATVQNAFVPLFERYHVALVLAGHDHDYERTNPINGVTYVVTGGGGRGTRSVGHSSFTAYSEDVLHFVDVEVDADTMTIHAIDGVGREFDSAQIPRPSQAS